MSTPTRLTILAATIAGLAATPALAQVGEAAQVIFTNDKLTVIDAKGVERVAKQGDFIQPGERLITPPGVVGQIKLPDGTLLGARPGSDIKLESIVRSLGKNVLVLNEGNVRVVNIDPPKGPKPMPVDVISPISTLQLTGGDGEAIHVKPGSNKPNIEPGTYNRLQLGTAIVRNDKGDLPLPPMQPVFAPKVGVPLAPIAFLPISLVKIEPVLATSLVAPTLISPTLSPNLTTISPTTINALSSPTLTYPTLSGTTLKTTTLTTSSVTTTGTLGTAPLVGTSTPSISPTLTPTYTSVISPTLMTTVAIKPPPPPPPPPPKVITCKTCVIIKR